MSATTLKLRNAFNGTLNILDMSNNTNKANIRIQDLRIDGNKSNQTAGVQNGIYAERVGYGTGSAAVNGLTVRNVEVRDFRTNGIQMYLSENGTIIDSSARGNNYGIYLDFGTKHITINNSELAGNASHGVTINSASYIKVLNSKLNQNSGNGYNMLGTSTSNNTISGNTILSNAGRGAYIDYGYATTFNDNTVASNGGTGLYLNGGISPAYAGITIGDNTISNNTGNGIQADRHVGNATITGNRIFNNTAYGINLHGYLSVENPKDNTITANYIYTNTLGGITLDQADDNAVQSNTLSNNGGATLNDAIRVIGGDGTNNTISGNVISDTSCTTNCNAIVISSATSTYVSGNSLGNGTISDTGVNTRYANQVDTNGNLMNRSSAGLTVNTLATNASLTLQGGMTNSQLPVPNQPTVTRTGTSGTSTYGYRVTALDGTGETLPSTERTITIANATLSVTNYNVITWVQVPGAVQYKIYRTQSNGTPATLGHIGTVTGGVTTSFSDTGIAATTAAPGANTTGGLSIAGTIQGSSAQFSSTLMVNGTFTSNGGAAFNSVAVFNNMALLKTDSTTAFQIQNSTSTPLLLADTSAMLLTVRSLAVTYNLTVAGHIITGGSAPTISANAAACASPTVSVSGTDTAGSITITTGTGCTAGGDLATVTFATAFGASPKVALTPAGASAAGLNAYLNDASLTTGGFTVGIVGTPADTTVYKWHYYALQ